MRATVAFLTLLLASCLTLAASPTSFVWESDFYGGGQAALRWPVGLASAAEREVVVAEAYKPRLIVFQQGRDSWSESLVIPLQEAPAGIAAGKDRYYFTLRGSGGLFVLPRTTWEPRRIPLPSGVVAGVLASANHGGVLVYDESSARVLDIDSSGQILTRMPVKGHVKAIAARGSGGLYVLDPVDASIRPYGPKAKESETRTLPSERGAPSWPVDLAAGPSGELIVADRGLSRLVVLDARGQVQGIGSRRGWEPGLLYRPSAVTLLPDGRIVVADQGNGRIQVFRRQDEAEEK